MAWSEVGESATVITAGSGDQSVTLPGTVLAGHLVEVLVVSDVVCDDIITTSDYTVTDNGTGTSPGWAYGWKVMGETPDSTVAITRNATIPRVCLVKVTAGVDTEDPVDIALATVSSGGESADSNSPNMVGVAANARITIWGALDDDDTTVSAWPEDYTDRLEGNTGQSSTTQGATAAMAARVTEGGNETTPAITFGTSDVNYAGSISFNMGAGGGEIPLTLGTTGGVATTTLTANASRSVGVAAAGIAATTVTLTKVVRESTTSAAGVATVAPSINVVRGLTATAAGVATTAPLPTVVLHASGEAAGTSTVALTLNAIRSMAVSAAGIASTTIGSGAARIVSAAAAGQSTTAVAMHATRSRSAAAAGTSTVALSAGVYRGAGAVSVAGTATTTAGLHVVRALSATSAGVGTATLTLGLAPVVRPITTSAAGLASVLLTLTSTVASSTGKYAPEHASALSDLAASTGFSGEHASALADLAQAGV